MHYLHSYEHDRRSPVTNSIVDGCGAEGEINKVEYLKMAKHAQYLEIKLAKAEQRLSDYAWKENPGQGMY